MKYIITCLLILSLPLVVNAKVRTIVPVSTMKVNNISNLHASDANAYDIEYGTKETEITFSLSTLPDTAKVTKAMLRLLIDEDVEYISLAAVAVGRTDGITIRNKNKWDYKKGDEVMMSTDDPLLFAKIINEAKNSSTKSVTLKIFTQQESKKYKIYNKTRYSNVDAGKVPRLVLEYEPDMPQVAWSGYLSDAQRTSAGTANFLESDKPDSIGYKKVITKLNITNLSFAKDKLQFIDQAGSSTALYSLDPITGKATTINNDLRPPSYMPTLSRDGYYYHVSREKIERINLKDGSSTPVLQISSITPPVLGKDGSMYVCNESFIMAYTPPPLYMQLWQYSIRNSGDNDVWVSPISLSTDDSIAYAIYGKKNYNKYTLAAINTINKQVDTVHIPMELGTDTLPAIVVSNNNFIYFIDGKTTGKNLYIFSKNLKEKSVIKNYSRFSRPVASNNNVYIVADNKLLKIRDNNVVDEMQVSVNTVHNITADKDDNVYILSGNKIIFCSFKGNRKSTPISQTFPTTDAFYNMLTAPDGSIYLNTNREIYTVRPTWFSKTQDTVSNVSFKYNTTFRTNKLLFHERESVRASNNNIFVGSKEIIIQPNVTFEKNTDNSFESGGKIIISKGFKVEKGARLSFKTGY